MICIAQVTRPCAGQTVCGDQIEVVEASASTVVALADGLGHGEAAAVAADAFCQYVRNASELPLNQILMGAHKQIAGTRGVVAAILRVGNNGRLAFSGVGNAELHARSQYPIRPLLARGVVGVRLTKATQFEYELCPGDVLVMHSDGLSSRFSLDNYAHLTPALIVETLLAEHGKMHDDASCVAIRYD